MHIKKTIITVVLCCLTVSAMAIGETPDNISDNVKKDTVALTQTQDIESLGIADALTHEDSMEIASLDKSMQKEKKKREKRDWTTWKPDAKRAMWLAIVLPGAGQIYNRKYWKLPIIYGGILGCAYAMRWNNQMYMDYSQAYLDIMDDDPTTQSYNQFLHLGRKITKDNEERYKQIFKSRKDTYRRWRDLSFFVMLGVYALSIIDAYVDASLSKFDISDDLSLRIAPTVMSTSTKSVKNNSPNADSPIKSSAIGVNAALTF